jgi:hypothetical protein
MSIVAASYSLYSRYRFTRQVIPIRSMKTSIEERRKQENAPSPPDFLYAALDTIACAVFFEENRMKCAEATSCTGNPGPNAWPIRIIFEPALRST